MSIRLNHFLIFTVTVAIMAIVLVVIIVIYRRLNRGRDLVIVSDSNSFDPNFIFEQSYYAGLNKIDRRIYNALPAKYKLRVLQTAKQNNMDDVRKINTIVAFNIAVEAKKIARSTTEELVAASTVESTNRIMADESIVVTKDAAFKSELESIANAIIPTSVKIMSDAIDNSWDDATIRTNLKTQLTLASNNAINAIVVNIADDAVKTQHMTQLTGVSNSIIGSTIDDLMTKFPIEVAKYNEAVFSTAGAMGFSVSYPVLDGSVVLDVKPIVYIVNGDVIVDINTTCNESIEHVSAILDERVRSGKLTREQANDVLTQEREHIRDYLERRIKNRSSIAFVAAGIAVNSA